jgi:DNA repair exonuclease SbcCD ATPase subunit
MADQTEKLLDMKERIEEAKRERDRVDGRLSVLKDKLKEEYDCNNLEESIKEQKGLEKKVSEKERKLHELVTKLENDYDWE